MSGAQHEVLVIDDEAEIRKFLRISLEAHGYRVREARTGGEALESAAAAPPDLAVLDLGLPDLDGQEVLRRLREWSDLPVIVLSVRAGESDKVTALDHGADDYVTKPFGIAEFLARVRVLLRKRDDSEPRPPRFRCGDLEVDLARHAVTLGGTPVSLTPKEFALLRVLAGHPGQPLTHRHLLREVWGEAFVAETHYLRVVIGHLRQKLGEDPTHPRYIITEQGVGYRLRGD